MVDARLVVEPHGGDRLEVGALPVGRHGDPGGAQRTGEPEEHLLGRAARHPCVIGASIASSARRTRSASSRYFTATPEGRGGGLGVEVAGAELVQGAGPVEGLGDAGRLEHLAVGADAVHEPHDLVGERRRHLGRPACATMASSRSMPGCSSQW